MDFQEGADVFPGAKLDFTGTEGSRLIGLLGPGKSFISQKSHIGKFLNNDRSNKINGK